MINDLKDLSKLQKNQFKVCDNDFNLSQTVYKAMKMIAFRAESLGVKLKAVIIDPINLDFIQSIQGDERIFTQVLFNFLGNALKFTNSQGQITVQIKVLEQQKIKEFPL